jgi:alpha-1,6-mannosyltransferase
LHLFKLNNRKSFLLLITAAVLSEALYIFFNLNNGSGDIGVYMFIYFEVFIVFIFAFYLLKKSEPAIVKIFKPAKFITKYFTKDETETSKIVFPIVIILFGIMFRITLIPSNPATSPDVYRYTWEGKVVYNGFNPYQYSPDSKQLESLRDDVYQKVTFKNIPTIYPPFAQVVFLTAYSLTGNNPIGLKLIYLLCEIVTMIFLLKLLLLKNVNPNYIILYAWLPLSIMEYFINAHIDVVGIMFLVLFIYFLEKEKVTAAVLAFTFSVLTKLYPVVLIPLLVNKLGAKRFIYFIFVFTFISLIFYYPFLNSSLSVKNALMNFVDRWEFNASIYYLLAAIFPDHETARLICGIFLFISIGYIASYYKNFIKGAFGVLLAVIIFSPVVYPWYLGWIAAVNPFAMFYSVISLFFTINLSNFSPLGKAWHEYFPVLFIEYFVFFVLLAYDLYHQKTGKTLKDFVK